MENLKTYIHLCLLTIILLLGACDDMTDKELPITGGVVGEENTAEIYILCEGLFNQNNSTLARHTFADNRTITNYFQTLNRRGMGDTANDMQLYDDKLFIVVNVSSQVEVIDWKSGLSIKQIPILQENGSSRQPRSMAFYQDKAYVCCFDGTVVRIDINSLTIDGTVQVGRNPDGICVQNSKLYVSNSGGLDTDGIGPDTTVSVIDLASFSKIKDITVGSNPGKIMAGWGNTVLVITRGDNIEKGDYHLIEIDCSLDEVSHTFSEKALNFTVNDELIYLYDYQYSTQSTTYKVLNQRNRQVVSEQFITDGTTIATPYGIFINPFNGNVYITDAYTYNVKGDILCFNPQGQLQYRLNNVGMNPNTIVFSDRASQSKVDDVPDNTDTNKAFANKVLEYRPAPGQYMNTTTMAYKEGFTEDDVLAYATERIKDKYIISLGGFGGYITLGFDAPINNVSGAYDFKVYGNAYYNMYGTMTGKLGGSAEPGIVLVSKDMNGNGLPDDEWYELAGSEYGTANETRGYEITYHRPTPLDGNVRWTDNRGGEGYVLRNTFHTQPSYYPLWVEENEITFTGTRLKNNAINENNMWIGYCYGWGYADNHPNNTEMSQFKIDWAVDDNGHSITLDQVDFVRIYTAINQDAGTMGEISTEVMTIENLHYKQ